jgi:Cu/Ag efflux protein CusF
MEVERSGLRLLALLLAMAIGLCAAEAGVRADRRGLDATPGFPAVTPAQQSEPTGLFHGTGVVTAIDPVSGAITLDHDEIKGLMPAMIMMYRVKSPSLAAGLRTGDRIAFTLDAGSYTIVEVEAVAAGK